MPLCFEKKSNLPDCFLFKKECKNKGKKIPLFLRKL